MSGNAPTATGVSHVYPIGSRLTERGRLEVGGCDVVELAEQFGTPAYVYAEDDIRARARQYMDAFRARTVGFVGDLLADLGQIVLTIGVVDMGQQCRACAQQVGAAA